MKYLLVTNSTEAKIYAELIFESIQRYDVRAEIYISKEGRIEGCTDSGEISANYSSIRLKELKKSALDLVIVIGEDCNRKLSTQTKRQGIFSCFIQITFDSTNGRKVFQKALNSFNKVFTDLPIYKEASISEHVGLYPNDIFRSRTFSDTSSDLRIGMLIDDRKKLKDCYNFIRDYSAEFKGCQWLIGGDITQASTGLGNIEVVKDVFQLLKLSNVVIVDNQRKSMEAALLNCPQVTISRKSGFLSKKKSWKPLINEIVEQDLIKNFPINKASLIVTELNSLLNDHEYCASILAGYQSFKEKVGTQPVARDVAQKIIEWLEEKVD